MVFKKGIIKQDFSKKQFCGLKSLAILFFIFQIKYFDHQVRKSTGRP